MQRFGRHPRLSSERLKSSEKNAFRKVNALRRYKPGIFWAVGPNRHEKVFSAYYSEDGVIEFESASLQALNRIA